MVVAGEAYWIVACSLVEQGREQIYSLLRQRLQTDKLATDTAVLEVPNNLKFGSFDELVRIADELQRHDQTCEQVLRRLERQVLDLDPRAELAVIYQRAALGIDAYLHRFSWDDTKYPRSRNLRDNVDIIMGTVNRIDDEVRVKAGAFSELKQSHTAGAKKENASYAQRDLVDILTSDVVKDGDFVETAHLTTVVAVVPRTNEDAWVKKYETYVPTVVPRSGVRFNLPPDKEGSSLWRVSLFKKNLEEFRGQARSNRVTIREFKYVAGALEAKLSERSKLEAEKDKQEAFMRRTCLASFSDVLIGWTHIKAVRVFVEATLRFGVPPNFAAFLVKPVHARERKLRKELDAIFTTKGLFGRAFIEGSSHQKNNAGQQEQNAAVAALQAEFGNEDYYPYVFLSIVPCTLYTKK